MVYIKELLTALLGAVLEAEALRARRAREGMDGKEISTASKLKVVRNIVKCLLVQVAAVARASGKAEYLLDKLAALSPDAVLPSHLGDAAFVHKDLQPEGGRAITQHAIVQRADRYAGTQRGPARAAEGLEAALANLGKREAALRLVLGSSTVTDALGPELANPDGFFAPPADAAHGTRGALLLAGLRSAAATELRIVQKQLAALKRVQEGVAELDLPSDGHRGHLQVGLARSSWRLVNGTMTPKAWARLAFSSADAGEEEGGEEAGEGAGDSDEEDEAGAPPAQNADAPSAHDEDE
jgi:hypothetical protein